MQSEPVGKFLETFAKAVSPEQVRKNREMRNNVKEGILAGKSALIWGEIDTLPRVDAPRLSVKRPKPVTFINHQARYRKLRHGS